MKTRIIDSRSDGRCGYVVVEDERGFRERVRWSHGIPGPQSQHQAIEEAERRLRAVDGPGEAP